MLLVPIEDFFVNFSSNFSTALLSLGYVVFIPSVHSAAVTIILWKKIEGVHCTRQKKYF